MMKTYLFDLLFKNIGPTLKVLKYNYDTIMPFAIIIKPVPEEICTILMNI